MKPTQTRCISLHLALALLALAACSSDSAPVEPALPADVTDVPPAGEADKPVVKARPSRPARPAPVAAPRFALDAALASKLVALSLECVDKPYLYKPGHVLHAEEHLKPPRELTPAFYGCFDWHSAVHGHWTMLRLLKRFPDLPEAKAIRAKLHAHLNEPTVTAELQFFKEARSKLFERPYGWGWLLRLAAELHTFEDVDAGVWASALEPLDTFLAAQSIDYLQRLTVPVRAGTHQSTAFAMVHMLDYARAVEDSKLEQAVKRRSRDFFLADRSCPTAYEPSGEDFISPCLTEADLMRRVLAPAEFVDWLDAFLPAHDSAEFDPLRNPVEVKDLKDPRIGHLIGLAFQRAWCFEGLASALPAGDTRIPVFRRLAAVHRERGLKEMFDSGYGGAHWLASFAIYLLTDTGPY